MIKWGIVIFAFLFLIGLVSGHIGVSPALYDVAFKPGLKQAFYFDFIGNEGMKFDVYLDGDLAEYAKLSANHLDQPGRVYVLLELPDSVDKPGKNKLYVGGRQVSEKEGGFGIVGNVKAMIRVDVPYPGKYAELELYSSNARIGEKVSFDLVINSKGKEGISTVSYIEIYNSLGERVETLSLGESEIEAGGSVKLSSSWEGGPAGKYTAAAVARYGGQESRAEAGFRIGELNIEILNYTSELEREKINKFDIVVESQWNDPIDNVYANVSIEGYSAGMVTPSISLDGFEKGTLSSYLDTSGIENSPFNAKIMVHYNNKSSEKLVELRFRDGGDYMMVGIIAGIILAVLIAGYIVWRVRRNGSKKR